MNILPRPPSDDPVDTLQYICASLIPTPKLLSLNLGHLCLPISRNGEFKKMLITPKNASVFNRETYTKLDSLLNNKTPTKSILDNILSIISNDSIQPMICSHKYKKYLSSRLGLSIDKEINIYDNSSNVVIQSDLIKDIKSYITNLHIVIDLLELLHKNAPLVEEEALYICDTFARNNKYVGFIKKAIQISCYNGVYAQRSFVSEYLLKAYIKPQTFSNIINLNLPELTFEIYQKFVADPYLPCVCYKDKDSDLYLLREIPGKMYDSTLNVCFNDCFICST